MSPEELVNINSWLAIKYGCLYDGRPKYRLVWANDLTEMRRGIFLDWNDFVGYTETEDTRLCPKYWYLTDQWILEKLDFNAKRLPDLVDQEKLPYECMFAFEDPLTRQYIEPRTELIDQLVYYDLNKSLIGHKPTEADAIKANAEFRAKETAKLRERIDDAIPDLPHALVHGHAVTVGETNGKKVLRPTQQRDDSDGDGK